MESPELGISEQPGFPIPWETGRPFSPTDAVTIKRDACFLFFVLFQCLHCSSPSVFFLYRMGAVLLKEQLMKKPQEFLSNSPPSNCIPSNPPHPLLNSLMNDLQNSSLTKIYLFNYKGKLRLLEKLWKEVGPGTKYFKKK